MKPNIFWRTTCRQPLRMMVLLLLTAVVAFAFTARAAEYLLVQQETERLGSYYKAIGKPARLSGAATSTMASFDEARAFLENDPRVDHVSWLQDCSAVIQGMYNADVFGVGAMDACKSTHYYFTGTLLGISEVRGFIGGKPFTTTLDGDSDVYCYFRQEQSLAGAPELVWEGHVVRVCVSKEDARAALEMLTIGKQYLICGRTYWLYQLPEDVLIEKPTVRNPKPSEPMLTFEYMDAGEQFKAFQLAPSGPLFYPIPENGEIDWSDPVLAGVEEEIRTCREEQSALWVMVTQDMEVMDDTQSNGRIHLMEGRWLNYEDHAEQKKVCVVHNELLKLRGLSIGDTITLKLRDIGWENHQWGYIIFPFMKDYKTKTETFQIVGSYDYMQPHPNGFHVYRNTVYIPFSAVPEDFDVFNDYTRRGLSASNLTFALTSPEVTEEFLADTRDALAEMTLQANMLDTGWDAFQEAVQPMLQSSLYNLVIFSLILFTALCFVTFFYLRARRRDMAIARAMGVPAGTCVRQSALPLLLIGFLGTLTGGCLGWQYALRHGASALAGLDSYGGVSDIALPYSYLAALLGGVLLLVLALAFGCTAWLARRPVLTLLQGGTQAKQKEVQTAQMAALDAIPKAAGAVAAPASGTFSAAPVQPAKHSFGVAHTLRFIGCYIRRSKVKSLLALTLAVLFTVGLAAIRISILHSGARMDELFNTVSVEMTLMPKRSSDYVMGGGFATQKTIDRIEETEFVQDAYLEGQCAIMRIRREDVFLSDGDSAERESTPRDGDTGWSSVNGPAAQMLSFDNLNSFLSNGSEAIEIVYHDGWDAQMFEKDWSSGDTLPVLIPAVLYENLHIPADGRIALDVLWEDTGTFHVHLVEVAGTYTGTPAASKRGDGSLCLLAPASVMDAVMQSHIAYSTARFTLDPAWNREMDTVRAAMEEITEVPAAGLIPLRPVLWDEELKQAVEPLENSIRMMEMLFPVALALSLLAALGVSALLILTEAREAAIMRVLGTTKLRSRIVLSLQMIFVGIAGLFIGLAVSFAWVGSMGLAWATMGLSALCAAAYLLCAAAGSAAGAVIVTNRPPLELLQVKE